MRCSRCTSIQLQSVGQRRRRGGLQLGGVRPRRGTQYTVSGISVSNFVAPAWFDQQAAQTAQFDKLSQVKAPFSILKGGYVVYGSAGQQQKVGDKFPDRRREMKSGKLARTRYRLEQAWAIGQTMGSRTKPRT